MIRGVTAWTPAGWWRGLGSLTRSGSASQGLSWALYDFANTIYSFAIVSFAMGPWAVRSLGEGLGTLAFTVAGSASVLLNALVSPALGAISDRTGGRKRYLLVFTVLCVVPTTLIGLVDIWLGLVAYGIANFAYQAALIYYDALLPDVAPSMVSVGLFWWEFNVRASTVLGVVGAGGIGQELYQAISLNYYEDVSAIVLMVVVTITLIDLVCERIRHRIIGRESLQWA